jgi:hypothetical protein
MKVMRLSNPPLPDFSVQVVHPLPAPPERLAAVVQLSLLPLYQHPALEAVPNPGERLGLKLTCNRWGNVGGLLLIPEGKHQTWLKLYVATYPFEDEVEPLEPQIREICSRTSLFFAEAYNRREDVLRCLSQTLFRERARHHLAFRERLYGLLAVFGWRALPEFALPPSFELIVQGSPAQLAVMLRHFSSGVGDIQCQVFNPADQQALVEFAPNANPVGIRLHNDEGRLEIIAHTLPEKMINGQVISSTLLRVGTGAGQIWDLVRDQMEKLAWFSLPTPDWFTYQQTSESSAQQQPPEPWELIPDRDWDRRGLQLWHEGIRLEVISRRLGISPKTVLNRFNLLRKQYGSWVIPYRRPRKNRQ